MQPEILFLQCKKCINKNKHNYNMCVIKDYYKERITSTILFPTSFKSKNISHIIYCQISFALNEKKTVILNLFPYLNLLMF